MGTLYPTHDGSARILFPPCWMCTSFISCNHQSYHLCPTDPPLWCGPYSFSPLCPSYLGKIKGLACLWGEQKL